MVTVVGLNDLSTALIEAGNTLLNPHSSTDELLTLLDKTESLLRNVEQDQPLSMRNALTPATNALVSIDLLSHPDSDVRVSVVSCLNEIMRITAPEAPYSDDRMKEIFRSTVEAFEKLADPSSRSYRKAESVLDNVSKVKSSLVMLDLECDDLILETFRKFLRIIRSDHPRAVFSSMEMIMITIIDETEEVSAELLAILLTNVKNETQNVSPMSRSLAEKVLSRCARKLKPCIIEALKSTGTTLDMYSPVVSSVCHSVFDTIKPHNVVNTKEKEADKSKSERQVDPSDSLEENCVELTRKENRSKSRSKRPARVGTRRNNESDKVRYGNSWNLSKQSLKQVRSESTDAETELGVTGKRGRKPNSLMNPEEGYDISWIFGRREPFRMSSKKKKQKRRSGGESSLGKVATKKTRLPKETSPATSRSLSGSVKRSRVKMDDSDSPSSPRLKKLESCFRDEEPREEESDDESFEKLEIDRTIEISSKKTRSQNGLEISPKTAKKKPILESKVVNSSGGKKSSARLDAKRKYSESASMDTPQSSKRKKNVSGIAARSFAEESEKSHPMRRRTTRKEVECNKNCFGEDLVGKRVNIWWPLDKTFYEGVVESYNSRKKKHRVVYLDGDSEQLNLVKERWELLDDRTYADEDDDEIDLPEGIPLSDIIRRHKVKKSKNMVESVEPTSSSDVRSSSRTLRKKGKGGSSKEKSREGKNLKSLKELNAKTDRREEEEQEVGRDVDEENKDEDDEAESENKGEDGEEESENEDKDDETMEEEKRYPHSEVESEGDDSESEEEPKWRETEDMEEDDDEAEEREKDNEAEEIEEDNEAEESEEDDDAEERENDEEAEEREQDNEAEEIEEDDEAKDNEAEEIEESDDEAKEREESDDDKRNSTSLSETEKEEDEEKRSS